MKIIKGAKYLYAEWSKQNHRIKFKSTSKLNNLCSL